MRTGRSRREIPGLIFEAEEESVINFLRHSLPDRQQLIELESCLTLGFVYRLVPRVADTSSIARKSEKENPVSLLLDNQKNRSPERRSRNDLTAAYRR